MKRKSLYNDNSSLYGAPPLESTLLLETGGVEEYNQIGELPSTNISASLSSGTRTFQYNRFFANNENYMFNYRNCGIGVAVAYYRAQTQTYCFAILPIFLPRVQMSILQNFTQNSPSDDTEQMTLLVDNLLYYLNIGFTSWGVGNAQTTYNRQANIPGSSKIVTSAPVMYAQDCKGYLTLNSTNLFQTVNNPNMPLFTDTTPPPLIWERVSSNGQICIRRNEAYWLDPLIAPVGDDIAFQIITLEDYMFGAPLIAYNSLVQNLSLVTNTSSVLTKEMISPSSGWCSEGPFLTGFGQRQFYEGNTHVSSLSYTDIYTSSERRLLFESTAFPAINPIPASPVQFTQFASSMKLDGFIVISFFITNLIPTRFMTIESEALTRNQKRPFISNNPYISPNTIAIQMTSIDRARTWDDYTVSGVSGSSNTLLFGSQKSGTDDCTIVSMDPMQSLQSLDLIMKDEWDNIIQNYVQIQGKIDLERDVMGYLENFYQVPGFMTLPAWVLAYNPNTSGGNTESLLLNESYWQTPQNGLFYNPDYSNSSIVGFNPMAPRSTTLTHFGRVIGY